jgi:zinc protease
MWKRIRTEAVGMAVTHPGSVVDYLERLFDAGTVHGQSEAQLLERFIESADAAAFEAIVARHGPMVLGVCRRLLSDPNDVDDAFQATFLILVARARSIRNRDVLGSWLHGVARRVAVRAQLMTRKRRGRESILSKETTMDDCSANLLEAAEVSSILDAELGRLPAGYRSALILCDLEDWPHQSAARHLGWPVGTVKSRLARGRAMLRARLVRRGVTSASLACVASLAAKTNAAVPARLLNSTVRAATELAAGGTVAAGVCSAGAVALVKGVTRSMPVNLPQLAAAGLLAVGARALVRPVAANPGPVALAPAAAAQQSGPDGAFNAAPSDEKTGSSKHDHRRIKFDNGLTVHLRPNSGAKQTALVILYSVGSDHDPAGRSGLGNLVEHVYLTAAAGREKARTVDEFMRRYPDGANAQTGDRYTMFATLFPANDLNDELRDAAARMSDLRITAADLERERPHVLEQIGNMFGGMAALAAQNHARQLVRPSPGAGRHGGELAQIRAATVDEVQAHWARYYKPRNAIVALTGEFDPAEAAKAIKTHFAGLAAGEPARLPHDPGTPQFGAVRELKVKPMQPTDVTTVALAYPAPEPGSALYAPFLVQVSRLAAASSKLGGGPFPFPVYFTPLDDGAVVIVSSPAQKGENAAKSIARLEAFVAETIGPPLHHRELVATSQELGPNLGAEAIPDDVLGQNPYGVAFELGRWEQLGVDPAALARSIEAVADPDLRWVATEVFAPSRHSGAFVVVEK